MQNEVIVAVIAFIGTALGTFGGIIASSKLTNYRIAKLEEKVDKHNSVIERTYKLEEKMETVCSRIERIERIERGN